MFIKISMILFTMFSISSSSCMEPEQPTQPPLKVSTRRLIKRKSQSLLRTLSNEQIDEEPVTNTIILEHPFIIAVHSAIKSDEKDYTAVQFHLRNPHLDPNITDQQGHSALQNFIKAKACRGVELLLTDHRIHFRHDDLFNQIHAFEC